MKENKIKCRHCGYEGEPHTERGRKKVVTLYCARCSNPVKTTRIKKGEKKSDGA